MKKIFLSIIAMLFIFAIQNTYAKDGLIEDSLNLNFWPVIYELSLDDINVYTFKNKSLRNSYESMVRYDDMVRNAIINEYENGSYSTQTINWVVNHYYVNWLYVD